MLQFVLVMLGFLLFALAMYVIALRWVPRGHFMQPAAELRRPGRVLRWICYLIGACHGVAGLVVCIDPPYGSGPLWSALVVGVAMGLFYVACGSVIWIAHRPKRLRNHRFPSRAERPIRHIAG